MVRTLDLLLVLANPTGIDLVKPAAPRLSQSFVRTGESLGRSMKRSPSATLPLGAWTSVVRPHHYAKNLLVFVPVFTAQAYQWSSLNAATLAFIAFSLVASAGYTWNDLLDRTADRSHPTKRKRALASGVIMPAQGVIAAPLLLALGLLAGLAVSPAFVTVVSVYALMNVFYSLFLKRWLMADVVALAAMYTIRVIGGAVAISVTMSHWLLVFSMFIFLCLALVKRYVELIKYRDEPTVTGLGRRSYRASDSPIVGLMAVVSFNAVTVFALYVSSQTAAALYERPEFLWFVCPVLAYWLGRVFLLAHRAEIDDDPVKFAIRDPASYLAGGLTVAIVLAAAL